MIAETSRKAFTAIQKELGARQQQVFDAIYDLGRASNEQIAEKLELPINYVTPRVNELVKFGFVGPEGLVKNRSGISAKAWSVREPEFERKVKELDCEG